MLQSSNKAVVYSTHTGFAEWDGGRSLLEGKHGAQIVFKVLTGVIRITIIHLTNNRRLIVCMHKC